MLKLIKQSHHSHVWFVILAAALLFVTACRPKPPIISMTPTATTTRILPTANPTIAGALTEEAISQVVPTETAVSVTPSATPCIAPETWVRYQVRAGDTLFSLAQLTGTEVEAIKTANCLPDDFLAIGQILYLPKLPPPPPPIVAAVPEAAQSACASLLSCPVDRQIGYLRPASAPNQPPPCTKETNTTEPYIDVLGSGSAFVGRRLYLFACQFDNPQTWQISLLNAKGESVPLEPTRDIDPLLPEDIQLLVEKGEHQLTVVWSIECDVLAEEHRLTIGANNDPANQAARTINVRDLGRPRLLVVPQVGRPGDTFELFYCALPPNESISIELFYGFEKTGDGQQFYFATELTDVANEAGNGRIPIESLTNDPLRNYYLSYGDETRSAEELFSLSEGGS